MSPKPKSRHSSRLSKGSETNKGLRSSAQSANSNNFESSTDSGINKESSLMFKELFDTTNAPNAAKENRQQLESAKSSSSSQAVGKKNKF